MSARTRALALVLSLPLALLACLLLTRLATSVADPAAIEPGRRTSELRAEFEPPDMDDATVQPPSLGPARTETAPAPRTPRTTEEPTLTAARGSAVVGLDGVVRGLDGELVENARVLVLGSGFSSRAASSAQQPLAEAMTGSDGRFLVAPLEAGSPCELVVEHPDYATRRVEDLVPLPIGRASAVVLLYPAASAAGRVVTPEGAPVPDAWVRVTAGASGTPTDPQARVHEATTEPDGSFLLGGLPRGNVVLTAGAPGRAHVTLAGGPGSGGLGHELELVLEPGATMEGLVTDAGHHPLPGARVEAFRQEQGSRQRRVETRCDERGRFVLEGLPPGSFHLTATADGFRPRRIGPIEAQAGELAIALDPAKRIEGRVLDSEGRGVAAARLTLWRPGGGETPPEHLHGFTAVSDERGAYSIPCPYQGVYRVEARADAGRVGTSPLTLLPYDTEVAHAEIVLADPARLVVRVADGSGRPIAGARVGVVRESAGLFGDRLPIEVAAYTDAAGVARLDAVPTGDLCVLVRAPERAPATLEARGVVPGSEHDLGEVVLGPACGLLGRVVDHRGRAVPGAEVLVLRTSPAVVGIPGRVHVLADAGGHFAATGLAAGRYAVTASLAGGGRLPDLHDQARGRELQVELLPGPMVDGVELVLAPAP